MLIMCVVKGNDTTSRLKQLGMEFTVWVFKHVRILLFSILVSIFRFQKLFSIFFFHLFFIFWCVQSQINQLKLMGPVILNAILKSLDSYSNMESGLSCAFDFAGLVPFYLFYQVIYLYSSIKLI